MFNILKKKNCIILFNFFSKEVLNAALGSSTEPTRLKLSICCNFRKNRYIIPDVEDTKNHLNETKNRDYPYYT